MLKTKLFTLIIIVLITVIGTCGTIGYFYYKKSQETIMTLQENNSKLEVAVSELSDTISALEIKYQEANKIITDLNTTLSESRVRNRELADRLAKHDISMLALQRPELVERIINNASENALRCFELLSGAPLTENERNAKNAREFNSECPWLFNNVNLP